MVRFRTWLKAGKMYVMKYFAPIGKLSVIFLILLAWLAPSILAVVTVMDRFSPTTILPDFEISVSPQTAITYPGGTLQTKITAKALGGYKHGIVLRLNEPLPLGVSLDMPPGELNQPFSPFDIRISVNQSVPEDKLQTVTINGRGNDGKQHSIKYDFMVQQRSVTPTPTPSTTTPLPNSTPNSPSPIRPPNGAHLPQSTSVVIDWSSVAGASQYKLELWGGVYTTMVPVDWENVTALTVGQMWQGGPYFWHVKARNSYGESDWSPTVSFAISASTGVTLYTDPNYGGQSFTFGVGDYDLSAYGLDRNASSLRDTNAGYHITFYDITGRPGYFDRDVPQLPADWNDQPHSMKIELH